MNFQKNRDELTKNYWETKYQTNDIGWDIGNISPPLKAYIDGIKDKNLRILIPGAGNSYEASYLLEKGFKNVTIVDLAEQPLANIIKRCPKFPSNKLINTNYFDFEGQFDLILEQTFFCAIHPTQRKNYVEKSNQLLVDKGEIAGLFFDFPLSPKGPPYGGSYDEYKSLFEDRYTIKTLEPCYNSLKPRANNELFFIFEKK